MHISDCSSDVCSSDLDHHLEGRRRRGIPRPAGCNAHADPQRGFAGPEQHALRRVAPGAFGQGDDALYQGRAQISAGNDEGTRAVRSHGLAGKVRVLKQGNPDDPAARFLSVALNSPAIAFTASGSDPEFDRRTTVLLIAATSFLNKGYSAPSIPKTTE